MQLRLILSLYYLINVTSNFIIGTNLWKTYGELRKKINKVMNKQQAGEFLLDINEYKYPRANETLRKIYKQLWQDYYECLKKTYAEIGSEKIMYPTAVEALEGTLVILKCQICISPVEAYMSDNIKWYFNNIVNNETNRLVEDSESNFISPEDKTLMIHNIQSEQAGQYWCQLGDILSISHHISIDTNSEGVEIVYPTTAPNMPHATLQKIMPLYNIKIHTTWTKWSLCSKCNAVGKKVRYGYCTLSLHTNIIKKSTIMAGKDLRDYKRQIADNEQNETIETATQSKLLDESVMGKVKMILHIFRNKLPCKSKYLPKEILNTPDIKNRKIEMMVRYCKVKCPQNVIFEVRDKKGNVLESANNSAGIYSMIQGMPTPSPLVIRTSIYQRYNKKGILRCPGNLIRDVPINWKVDNKSLNPSVIKNQSQGRIYINPQMHIIFESLKFTDSNIYSCWQKNEIVGVVKLNVTGEIELQTNYSVIMVGGILIIIVFIIVFWRVFQGRKRFTKH